MRKNINVFGGLWAFLMVFLASTPAFAQVSTMNDIFGNVMASFEETGPFLSAIAYLLGSLWAALGVRDLQKAVEEEQTPMRKGWIKLIAGGMLFATPLLIDVVGNSFRGDPTNAQPPLLQGTDSTANILNLLTIQLSEGVAGQGYPVLNDIFLNLIGTTNTLPVTFALSAYFFALITLIMAIPKIKEHVEDPDKTPISEPVKRILFAGALLALPTVLFASAALIRGENSGWSNVPNIISTAFFADIMTSGETAEVCVQGTVAGGGTLGSVICQLAVTTNFFPLLLAFGAYVMGIFLVMWGVFKIRDHANNPSQTPLMEGIMRIIAGGALITLPYAIYTVRTALLNDTMLASTGGGAGPSKVTSFNEAGLDLSTCGEGLDSMLGCLMWSTFGPMNVILNLFSVFAGVLFIVIGVSRLTKGMQEGAKGPVGIGTIMTFIAGAALISSGPLLKVFANSMFNDPTANTFAVMQYTDGMTPDELSHVHIVISAILKFLVIIGFISFIRGIFILRGAAEGEQNSSFMAASTHLIGGALAVNLGPLLGVLQNTLGIAQYGIAFS